MTSYEAARASTRLLVPCNHIPVAVPSRGWSEAVVSSGGAGAAVGAGGARERVHVAGLSPVGWRKIGEAAGAIVLQVPKAWRL